MSIKSEYARFMSQFDVFDLDDIPPELNYRDIVLALQVQYPFQVARILSAPRGPTHFQDALVGVIVPHVTEDDVNIVLSRVSEKPLEGGSIDLKSGEIYMPSPESILVNPNAFVNSIILASLFYYRRGEFEVVKKMMGYIEEIKPYLAQAGGLWIISANTAAAPFAVLGNIESDSQLIDPYSHQEAIFPNTIIPGTKLS